MLVRVEIRKIDFLKDIANICVFSIMKMIKNSIIITITWFFFSFLSFSQENDFQTMEFSNTQEKDY